jgi:hypothetical protein
LLATGADIRLAGLRGVDTADIEAEGLTRGRQVCDLLQFRQLERRPYWPPPAPTAARDRMGHA